MALINFYNETVEAIYNSGHLIEDVDFCQVIRCNDTDNTYKYDSKIYQFSFEVFKRNANFKYNDKSKIIDKSLKIVFKDGSWMERTLYKNNQWWDFYFLPKKNEELIINAETIDFINCDDDDIQKDFEIFLKNNLTV